jgi:hypothetical protein
VTLDPRAASGFASAADAYERATVLDRVRQLVAADGRLTLRYRTELYWTRLA